MEVILGHALGALRLDVPGGELLVDLLVALGTTAQVALHLGREVGAGDLAARVDGLRDRVDELAAAAGGDAVEPALAVLLRDELAVALECLLQTGALVGGGGAVADEIAQVHHDAVDLARGRLPRLEVVEHTLGAQERVTDLRRLLDAGVTGWGEAGGLTGRVLDLVGGELGVDAGDEGVGGLPKARPGSRPSAGPSGRRPESL